MKAKAVNHPNGDRTTEEEALPEEEEEVEAEEATQHQDLLGVHQAEETQFPLDQTYPLTFDPFPAPMIRGQWETSPMSSTEIEPKQRHSSTS